ncbi:MAG: sodium:solute symporter family transporter [bacterium]
MNFETYLYIGFTIYLFFVIYVGFIGSKRIKELSDFSVAGEALGPIPVGLAFTATFFSAATFLGYVGYAYAWGQTALWIFVAIFGGSTFGLILIAKGVRERNVEIKALSLPDWLGTIYNSDVLRALVSLIIMIQVFYVGGQFSAGGTLLNGLIGIDYKLATIIIAAVTVTYVTLGGLFADVYTSIGQTMLMMLTGVIVFLSGFLFFKGGLTEVSSILAQENPHFIALTNPNALHMYAWSAVFGVILVEFAFSGQPQLLTKILALKDPKDMKKMIWTWIVAAFLCMLVIFGGLYMRAIDPTIQAADYAVVEYVKRFFHPIVSTILAVSIVAALMSTACGLLLLMTTCIANDLYLKIFVKNKLVNVAEENARKVALTMTKILPTIFGIICVWLALNPPAFMGVMVWIGISGVASATLAPMLFALLWPKRVNATAAIIGLIAGEGTYMILYMITKIEKSVMAAGAWGVVASFIAMWIASSILSGKEEVEA